MDELYEHINTWAKFLRRDEDNIFNALFFDKEDVTEEDVACFVKEAAEFFDLPLPVVHDSCETMAKVISHNMADYEVFYNWKSLGQSGINNKDAFNLVMTHELCHHVFRSTRFFYCRNEQWNQELVCDFMVGVRAEAYGIATGKYKYVVGSTKACITHPPGYFRKAMVEFGRKAARKVIDQGKKIKVFTLVDDFNEVMEVNCNQLNSDWQFFVRHSDDPKPVHKPKAIEDLPDTNLIKQAVLKYRQQEKSRSNE